MIALTAQDRSDIAEAVRKAELNTSGEIFCVLARRSDSYFFEAAFILMLAGLFAGLGLAILTEYLWMSIRLPFFVLIQIASALCALIVLYAFPALRLLLIPKLVLFRTAHENAQRQFMTRNVHHTQGRTGVLIFVSLAEHYATLIADSAIDDQVDQAEWNRLVADLVNEVQRGELAKGYIGAIEQAGRLLAAKFPRHLEDRNELDDHIVII